MEYRRKNAFTKVPKITTKAEKLGHNLSKLSKGIVPKYKESKKSTPFLLKYSRGVSLRS